MVEPYEPRWVRVEGKRDRCSGCGELVVVVWKLFVSPTSSTLVYCDGCVEALLAE